MSIVRIINSRRTDKKVGGTCSTYREVRNIYEIDVGTRETYKLHGITRRRKENII